jgi:hypothetical protein
VVDENVSRTGAGRTGPSLARIAAEIAGLAGELTGAGTVGDLLDGVVQTAVALVPGADFAGFTTAEHPHPATASTHRVAGELDRLQARLAEGPASRAIVGGEFEVATADRLGESALWPEFGPAAAELGVHGALAVGLTVSGSPPGRGVLNLYRRDAEDFGEDDRHVAVLVAAHAATALARFGTAHAAEAAQLREALRNREIIGQAKGILMHQRGIDAEEAFEVLRGMSQRLNTKVAELAAALCANHAELMSPDDS